MIRFDREQYTLAVRLEPAAAPQQLMWGSMLFHVGVLMIFVGHFVGLLTPIWVFDAIGIRTASSRCWPSWSAALPASSAWSAALMLLHRRLFDPRIRATSSFGDIAILLLLIAQLLLGLATIPVSAAISTAARWSKFMTWAQGIFTFAPGMPTLVADVHPIFKLHIFLGLTIFLLFPFTRLVHMLSRADLVRRASWRRSLRSTTWLCSRACVPGPTLPASRSAVSQVLPSETSSPAPTIPRGCL